MQIFDLKKWVSVWTEASCSEVEVHKINKFLLETASKRIISLHLAKEISMTHWKSRVSIQSEVEKDLDQSKQNNIFQTHDMNPLWKSNKEESSDVDELCWIFLNFIFFSCVLCTRHCACAFSWMNSDASRRIETWIAVQQWKWVAVAGNGANIILWRALLRNMKWKSAQCQSFCRNQSWLNLFS